MAATLAARGSQSSPILVSDDEDEYSTRSQIAVPIAKPRTSINQPGGSDMQKTSNALKKRKREDLGVTAVAMAGPSHSGPVPIHFESKKSRKRRRKMEREEQARQAHVMSQSFAMHPFLPAPGVWAPPPSALPPFQLPLPPLFPPPPFMFPEQAVFNHSAPPMVIPMPVPPPFHPPSIYNPLSVGPSSNQYDQREEPSAWVASMTAAGDADYWGPYDSFPTSDIPTPLLAPPPPPPAIAPPPPPPAKAASPPKPPPPPPLPAPQPPAPLAKPVQVLTKKPVSTIIGMHPDQDKHSKHGTFTYSPQTIASGQHSDKYIPNPARTIVMEQLPKTCRNRDFIKTWSNSAAGALPVYFAIDPSSAKALIEFTTAELARKAWGSPKLAGGSGPPVKGKPREDLIRVWWYRVPGVGANAGVGELEEGEIEGDDMEVPSAPPPVVAEKKETKKERKARLAKEREAKRKMQEANTLLEASMSWSQVSSTNEAGPSTLASANIVEKDIDVDMDIAALYLPPPPNTGETDMEIATTPVSPVAPSVVYELPMRPFVQPVWNEAPVEPRAMKNAPTAPSFTKRSLLARQKELEERITKGKLELEMKGVQAEAPPAASPVIPSTISSRSSTPAASEDVVIDAAAMEDNLRQLVLKSQRNKAKVSAVKVEPTVLVVPPVVSLPAVNTPTNDLAVLSLDDLAASFITETIQMMPSSIITQPAASAPVSNESSRVKEELSAKQRRLEAQIAESKQLMEQLTSAKTKHDRDRILAVIKVKSRSMDEEMEPKSNISPPPAPTVVIKARALQDSEMIVDLPLFQSKWPDTRNAPCVLILSDDEDDEDDSHHDEG